MDFATIIGLILAWGSLVACLALEGSGLKEMLNLPAFILVVFGTIGAGLITTSMKTLFNLPAIMLTVFSSHSTDMQETIDTMVAYAKIARRQGVLALDNLTNKMNDKFLKKGIELVVDGTPSLMVREVLETEIAVMQERHKAGEQIFTVLGGFSPTLGIIGTVLGLINMLSRLSEPGKMGHAIASAFVATLYGVALANLFYLPIAGKLKAKSSQEVITYEMIIEGILAIQAGESPKTVESRMMSFLPPSQRQIRESDMEYLKNEESLAA